MLDICEKIWKCSVPSVPGFNGGPVDPKPAKRVDMTLKKQGGIRGFFIRLSSAVEPKPEP